jgi:hypothetical protein
MIINNKLDKAFGPVGSSAGIFLLIAGLGISYFSFSGLILVLPGAFIGFTSTSTAIDFDMKRIRFSNNLFGIIKTGKWISIEPDMKIGIKSLTRGWRAYGRGNQTFDIKTKDFRLVLQDSGNKQILQIKKTDTLDSAKVELIKLSYQLGIRMV